MQPNDEEPVARFAEAVRRHRPAVYDNLQRPGASAAEIDGFIARTGLAVPPLARRWLMWTAGERAPGPRLIDNWDPMSLAAIEHSWEVCQQVWLADPRGEHVYRGGWSRDWLPLLTNGGGDYLCLDLAGELGPPGGVVVHYHDTRSRPVGPGSFAQWLELAAAATAASPEDPWLPDATFRSVDLVRDAALYERRSAEALAAAGTLLWEPRDHEVLGSAGLDAEFRAMFPLLDDGLWTLLRRAAEHEPGFVPAAAPLHAEVREVGTAPDGYPVERAALCESDGRVALVLDEYVEPSAVLALDDRVLVVGASLWLLRRGRTGTWIPLDRLALPPSLARANVHPLRGGRLVVLERGATGDLAVVAVEPARLRWLGAAALPVTGDALTELARVGDRLFFAVGHGAPGGELHELVLP